jgi:hypothetical protein
VRHRYAVLRRQPLRDQRAVTGLRIPLDTEKRGRPIGRQFRHDRPEVDPIEDLLRVPLRELRRELRARALADAEPLVLAVLQLP